MGCDYADRTDEFFRYHFNPRTHVGCDLHAVVLYPPRTISIHAPTWGATKQNKAHGHDCRFQSTHPRGVRPLAIRQEANAINFNPRTHVGCDTLYPVMVDTLLPFQSTHPRGVRPGDMSAAGLARLFQSTHPRGVRPVGNRSFVMIFDISIHAPTWGATSDHDSDGSDDSISIHAPTWGATCDLLIISSNSLFQSTHPRGVRRNYLIHSRHVRYFNPRTHVGCDWYIPNKTSACCYFNPRTHVGCDRRGGSLSEISHNFNPRTHVGCDMVVDVTVDDGSGFQSTHPRGVRRI